MTKKQMLKTQAARSVNGNTAPEGSALQPPDDLIPNEVEALEAAPRTEEFLEALLAERETPTQVSPPQEANDLANWDLEALRVPESTTIITDEPVLTTLEVRKPKKQEWFRVRPGAVWQFPTAVLMTEDNRTVYLVTPMVQEALEDDVFYACLYTVVTRTGTMFLWPVRLVLPDKPTGGDSWYRSAHDAAKLAETTWIRLTPGKGGYQVRTAQVSAEPRLEYASLLNQRASGTRVS
jgi:hypothetical protein